MLRTPHWSVGRDVLVREGRARRGIARAHERAAPQQRRMRLLAFPHGRTTSRALLFQSERRILRVRILELRAAGGGRKGAGWAGPGRLRKSVKVCERRLVSGSGRCKPRLLRAFPLLSPYAIRSPFPGS